MGHVLCEKGDGDESGCDDQDGGIGEHDDLGVLAQ